MSEAERHPKRRPVTNVILGVGSCLFLGTTSGANVGAQAPTIPVVVETLTLSQSDASARDFGDIYVTLRNTGMRTITAWAISAEVRFANGRVERRTHTTDRFELDASSFLSPGGTVSTRMNTLQPNARPLAPVDAVASVTAVIFENGSSIGDERLLGWLFHRRDLHRRVWELLEGSLATDRVVPIGVASLRDVEAAFESWLDSDLRNTAAYNHIRGHIQSALESGTTTTAGQVLAELQELASVRRATAVAHSRRP